MKQWSDKQTNKPVKSTASLSFNQQANWTNKQFRTFSLFLTRRKNLHTWTVEKLSFDWRNSVPHCALKPWPYKSANRSKTDKTDKQAQDIRRRLRNQPDGSTRWRIVKELLWQAQVYTTVVQTLTKKTVQWVHNYYGWLWGEQSPNWLSPVHPFHPGGFQCFPVDCWHILYNIQSKSWTVISG